MKNLGASWWRDWKSKLGFVYFMYLQTSFSTKVNEKQDLKGWVKLEDSFLDIPSHRYLVDAHLTKRKGPNPCWTAGMNYEPIIFRDKSLSGDLHDRHSLRSRTKIKQTSTRQFVATWSCKTATTWGKFLCHPLNLLCMPTDATTLWMLAQPSAKLVWCEHNTINVHEQTTSLPLPDFWYFLSIDMAERDRPPP